MAGCCSFTAWRDRCYRYSFSGAGLKSATADLGDGTIMHCWVPGTHKESKPTLLLIHGIGANAMWQWNDFISPLIRRFNVYVPDLVFFGDSYTTRPDRSESFQARCVISLMEAHGVRKMSVVGMSYGGFVAYSMAAQFPEKVEKVVLCCAGVTLEEKDMDEGMFQVKGVDEAVNVLLPQTPENMKKLIQMTFVKPMKVLPSCFLSDYIEIYVMAEGGSAKQRFRVWTAEEDDVLVASLLQLHEEGALLADNGFRPGVLKQLHAMLHAKLPGCDLKIYPNIQSRLKTLKLNWQVVNDMVNGVNSSGFGWDPECHCVTAEKAVWDEYVKSNKKAAQFRGKPFRHFDALSIIFAKDRASGKETFSSLQDDQVDMTEEDPHLIVDDNADDVQVHMDVEGAPSIDGMNAESAATLTGNKKRKRNNRDDLFLEALQKMVNTTCGGLQQASETLGASLQKMDRAAMLDAKREVLFDELSKLEELTEAEVEDALLKIIKDEELLVVFPTLPYKGKLSVVRRLLA